jgi:hypothetical protein
MVVDGIEEGMVERKRKQADAVASVDPKERRRSEGDGGSSSGGDDDGYESPTKKQRARNSSQGHAQRLAEAIQLCVSAVEEAGAPPPPPPLYLRTANSQSNSVTHQLLSRLYYPPPLTPNLPQAKDWASHCLIRVRSPSTTAGAPLPGPRYPSSCALEA